MDECSPCTMYQRRSECFWYPGHRLSFGAPSRPHPENFVIHRNLQNRFKLFTKFDYFKIKNSSFSRAIFSSGGAIWAQHFHIFGRPCVLVNMVAPKRQLTMMFLRNRPKLFYKTVTLHYLLAPLTPLRPFQPGARGGLPLPP